MTKKTIDFQKTLRELEEINTWFQGEDIDLDLALVKLKKGRQLIDDCRQSLKNAENEFIKIKKDSD